MSPPKIVAEFPVVTHDDNGIRPAGKPDACFYCRARVGESHGAECVVIVKRVRVRYSFELEIEVPHSWTDDDIRFHRGESSWCANNAFSELDSAFPDGAPCACEGFSCEVLGVADDTPRRSGN